MRPQGSLEIWTEHPHVSYEKGPVSSSGLPVTTQTRALGSPRTTWHFCDPPTSPAGRESDLGDLGETARTLDDVDGPVALERGLPPRHGYAGVEDSRSRALTGDGWTGHT